MKDVISKFSKHYRLIVDGGFYNYWKTKILKKLRIILTRKYSVAKRWEALKDKYSGKRAFLIGNGPSLNETPLHLLKHEFTFCFNRFNIMFERINWIPTFYSTVDERVAEDMADEINEITKVVQYNFFPDMDPVIGLDFRKFVIPRENVFWLFLFGKRKFSVNLPKAGINGTVAHIGFQVLAYMGFKEIYLVGLDMNYSIPETVIKNDDRNYTASKDDDPNHFDPRYFGKDRKFHRPRIDDIVHPSYVRAKNFFDQQGVKIYNATIGGKLEVFPRVDIHSLFNYSQKEELKLFLSEMQVSGDPDSLKDAFPSAKQINDVNDWDANAEQMIAPFDVGRSLVIKSIFTHIPYGPLLGEYLFVKRK